MTALELTTWSGVDKGGPFLLMFGHIDTAETPDVMQWGRIGHDGRLHGYGAATYTDADTFEVSGTDQFQTFIARAANGACDFSITSDELTLVMDGVTIIVRQET